MHRSNLYHMQSECRTVHVGPIAVIQLNLRDYGWEDGKLYNCRRKHEYLGMPQYSSGSASSISPPISVIHQQILGYPQPKEPSEDVYSFECKSKE